MTKLAREARAAELRQELAGIEEQNRSEKKTTLKFWAKRLARVGKLLGWRAEYKGGANINEGGVAVSGDAYAIFWKNDEGGVFISACPDAFDSLGVMYRRCSKEDKYGTRGDRDNCWISAEVSEEDFAEAIRSEVK